MDLRFVTTCAAVALGLAAAGCGTGTQGPQVAAPATDGRDEPASRETTGTIADVTGAPEPAEQAAFDCEGGLVVDGVPYRVDWRGAGAIPDLGERIGTVENSFDCGSPVPAGDGIWASLLPTGAAVYAIATRPVSEALVVVAGDETFLVRTPESLSVEGVVATGEPAAEVVAIGINSEFDGTTRFATIDEPVVVAALLAVLRSADATGDLTPLSDGERYFIEFVHADGLSTIIPYAVGRAQLWDRPVGDAWATAIADALLDAEGPTAVDGFLVRSPSASTLLHPRGSCRTDLADLVATPGEVLTVAFDEGDEVRWWLNPPVPGDGMLRPIPSQVGPTLLVPDFDGSLIAELTTYVNGGGVLAEACFTLVSTGSADSPGPVPTGMLDCSDQGTEPTGAAGLGDGSGFPTIDDAVADWVAAAATAGRPDLLGLSPVTSPYAAVADLIDGDGRAQVVLGLADAGDGWYVEQATVCPAP